jgi:hypothetical protein
MDDPMDFSDSGPRKGRLETTIDVVAEAAAAAGDRGLLAELNSKTPIWQRDASGRLVRVGGGKPKKFKGGARCAPGSRQRQAMRVVVATMLAAAGWVGGPIALGTLQSAGKSLASAECTISMGGSSVTNALCAKYFDLIQATNSLIITANASSSLQQAIAFIGGISVAGAFKSVKAALVNIFTTSKDTFEKAVDEFCALVFDDEGNIIPQKAAAAPAAAGTGMEEGGRRKKTRRGRGKKMGKSRRARRATSRTPLFIY